MAKKPNTNLLDKALLEKESKKIIDGSNVSFKANKPAEKDSLAKVTVNLAADNQDEEEDLPPPMLSFKQA